MRRTFSSSTMVREIGVGESNSCGVP